MPLNCTISVARLVLNVSVPVGETVAAFMSGMSDHAGSSGTAMSSPSHKGGKGTIVLQDSPQLTTKVRN